VQPAVTATATAKLSRTQSTSGKNITSDQLAAKNNNQSATTRNVSHNYYEIGSSQKREQPTGHDNSGTSKNSK